MDLSNISRRSWIRIVIISICLLSLIVFLIAYFGLDYPTPASNFWVSYPTTYISDPITKIRIAIAVTIMVVVGGVGSFYAILCMLQRKAIEHDETNNEVEDDENSS